MTSDPLWVVQLALLVIILISLIYGYFRLKNIEKRLYSMELSLLYDDHDTT